MKNNSQNKINKKTFRIGRIKVTLLSMAIVWFSICLLILMPITILHFSEYAFSLRILSIVSIICCVTLLVLLSKYLDCRIVLDKNCLIYKGFKNYTGAAYCVPKEKRAYIRPKEEILGYGDKINYDEIDGIYNIRIQYSFFRSQVVKYIAFVLKNDKPLYIKADLFSDRQIKRLIDEIIELSGNSIKDMRSCISENA